MSELRENSPSAAELGSRRSPRAAVGRRQFLALGASGVDLFGRGNAEPLRRLVISVNAMFDRSAHSGKGLGSGEVSLFKYLSRKNGPRIRNQRSLLRRSRIGRRLSAAARILGDPGSVSGAENDQTYSVTDALGYDIDRDRTGGSSMGPRPRTRQSAPSPFYKIYLGLKDARDTTLPHEYAHHFTLDTQRTASVAGNLWADLRNDYWLWRQRHGVPVVEFRRCANSEWARFSMLLRHRYEIQKHTASQSFHRFVRIQP